MTPFEKARTSENRRATWPSLFFDLYPHIPARHLWLASPVLLPHCSLQFVDLLLEFSHLLHQGVTLSAEGR